MDSSTSNTSNMASTQPYISNPNLGEVQPQPAAATQTTPVTVDVTAANTPTVEKETPKAGFDSDKTSVSPVYIKNNMAPWLNKKPEDSDIVNQNGERLNLTNSVSDPDKLRESFRLGYITMDKFRNDFNKQKQDIDNLKSKFPEWTFMPATHMGTVICYNAVTGKTCTSEELQSQLA